MRPFDMPKYALAFILMLGSITCISQAQEDSTSPRTLRLAFHVFNDAGGNGNFQSDSTSHLVFFNRLIDWINFKMNHLDSLRPEVSSPYIPSMNLQIQVDTVYYHQDTYAWDCSDSLDSEYMWRQFVALNPDLDYRAKYQTLPILIGDNYPVMGGHVSKLGSKRFVAMRGMYSLYERAGMESAVFECGRNLFHEIGHALGLNHNFQGGVSGDQCDECEDNGCPKEGTSNNLMDYWPSYGGGLSDCQMELVNAHLSGLKGDIADVLVNDSCYRNSQAFPDTLQGKMVISGVYYLHNSLVLDRGAVLEVSGTLSIPHNCFLEILPGAKLIVEGGELTNLCGDLWAGIQIGPGGADSLFPSIILTDSARVSHAQIGIMGRGFLSWSVTSCSFLNCVKSMELDQVAGDLSIRNSRFLIQNDFHRREEGAHPEVFLTINRSNVQVVDCDFLNTDQFRFFTPVESGRGIEVRDSKLELSQSRFSFLQTGVILWGGERWKNLNLESNTFYFCQVGIRLNQVPLAKIAGNAFTINRLDSGPAIGLLAEKPGWLQISGNNFRSEFGGDQLLGYLQKGTRGGTQYLWNNRFSRLGWGVLHQADEKELNWPECFFNLKDMQAIKGHGLFLDQNLCDTVSIRYSILAPDGRGIADTEKPAPADLNRLEEVVSWPIGGLAVFNPYDSLALIASKQLWVASDYSGQNFYLNRLSNSVEDRTQNMEKELRAAWLEDPLLPSLAPDSDLSVWINWEEFIRTHPFSLRSSRFRQTFLTELQDWSPWALNYFIQLSQQADSLDLATIGFIRKITREQMDLLEELDQQAFFPLQAIEEWEANPAPTQFLPDDLFRARYYPKNQNSRFAFSLYPNPVSELLHILPGEAYQLGGSELLNYQISSIQSRIIETGTIQRMAELVLPVSHLASGTYFISLWDRKRFYGTQKFIILRP